MVSGYLMGLRDIVELNTKHFRDTKPKIFYDR